MSAEPTPKTVVRRGRGAYLRAMLQIAGIDHLVLRAHDAPRLVAFYTEVLGLKVERVQEGIGLTQLRAGASLIDIVAVDGPLGKLGGAGPGAEGRNLDHFCLNVVGFELAAVKAWLESHGVKIGEAGIRYGSGGQGMSLYLKDPEGNGLELRA